MAITNQQNINQVQGLFPAVGPNPTDEGGLFRLAADGGLNATKKLAGGEGGPDFLCTADTTAADTVNFDIPFASLLKRYAAQQSGVTFLALKCKVMISAAAVANSAYYEVVASFQDVAGTMTLTAAQVSVVAIEGTAQADPALTNNGANTLRIAVTETGAVAHQVRVELFVNHMR